MEAFGKTIHSIATPLRHAHCFDPLTSSALAFGPGDQPLFAYGEGAACREEREREVVLATVKNQVGFKQKSLGFPPGCQRIGDIESSDVLDAIAEFAAETKSNSRSQNGQGTRSLEQGQLERLGTVSKCIQRSGDVS
jgi:hypothetical protein